ARARKTLLLSPRNARARGARRAIARGPGREKPLYPRAARARMGPRRVPPRTLPGERRRETPRRGRFPRRNMAPARRYRAPPGVRRLALRARRRARRAHRHPGPDHTIVGHTTVEAPRSAAPQETRRGARRNARALPRARTVPLRSRLPLARAALTKSP